MSVTVDDGPRSKRAQILTVATEHFGTVGYEHTKWASIADEVGIGQTALYHYFESKAHCLLTIMRNQLGDSRRILRKNGLSKRTSTPLPTGLPDRGRNPETLVFQQSEFFVNKFAEKYFGMFLRGAILSTRAEIIAH